MRLDQAGQIMLGDREVSRVYLGANLVWGGAFSPASLFAQGEPGVWYDPSDFSTLYQAAAGTTPVTAVGQPVGLMLDKSRGMLLGPELVTNGTFDTDLTGWTAGIGTNGTVSVESGRLAIRVSSGFAVSFVSQSIGAMPNGGAIKIAGDFDRSTSVATVRVQVVTVPFSSQPSVDFRTGVGLSAIWQIPPGTTNVFVRLTNPGSGGGVDGTVYYDNISVRELPGYHASQPTATARPIYRASPARIDFDAVDDALITTFPASLGSNCTIARAVPGVGAQILAGQTVGTTFSDRTDHAGLVIINRALTPSETTALTAYLTAKVAA